MPFTMSKMWNALISAAPVTEPRPDIAGWFYASLYKVYKKCFAGVLQTELRFRTNLLYALVCIYQIYSLEYIDAMEIPSASSIARMNMLLMLAARQLETMVLETCVFIPRG